MTGGRLLVAVATVAAVLGGVAFVSGNRVVAALGGLFAISAASMSTRAARAAGGTLARYRLEGEEPGARADRLGPPALGPTTPDGILTEPFLHVTLQNRVAVARRALRPLSVILLEVLPVEAEGAEWVTEELVTRSLSSTLRESDISGRRADGVYVFILEDTGEDGAVWTAERMRRNLASATGQRRFRAGVASYPSHGLDAQAIVAKAVAALDVAREWKRDRIEVATGG